MFGRNKEKGVQRSGSGVTRGEREKKVAVLGPDLPREKLWSSSSDFTKQIE